MNDYTQEELLFVWLAACAKLDDRARSAVARTCAQGLPLSELKADDGELRFNLCRERNIKGRKTEFSTWSPLAMLGNWHQHDNYGTLRLPE